MTLQKFAREMVKNAGIKDFLEKMDKNRIEEVKRKARTPKYKVGKEGLRGAAYGGLAGLGIGPILRLAQRAGPVKLRSLAKAGLLGGGIAAPIMGALTGATALERNRRIEEARRYVKSLPPEAKGK